MINIDQYDIVCIKMRNLPIAKVVCWKCKQGDKTLKRLRDEFGEKTPDYVCVDCEVYGAPKEPNQSLLYYPTKQQMDRMYQVLKENERKAKEEANEQSSETQGVSV